MSKIFVNEIQATSGGNKVFVDNNRPHMFCRGFGSVTTATPVINGQTMDTSWGIHYNADEVTENQGNHYTNSTGFFRVPVTGIYCVTAGLSLIHI